MLRFLLKRIVGLIFVLSGASFITFIMGYFAPGDPVVDMMGNHFDPHTYQRLKHVYSLDLPWWQQYYQFLSNILHGTFGYSFQNLGQSAWDVLQRGLPYSIDLGIEVLVVTLILGIPLGILSALRSNTHIDTTVTSIMMTLYAIPNVVLIVAFQLCMIWLYDNGLPHLPVVGWNSWQSHIGPVLITATTGAGYFTRITRTTVLEVMGQDFIRTARAKGIREFMVFARHVMRYSSIPLLTSIGPSLGYLVTGIYITELFFSIPGASQVTLEAISQRDYPVLQASVLLTCFSVVFFNALIDVAYTLVDPRIRLT